MNLAPCSGVKCGKELPVAGDWLQLDYPKEGFRLFCNLGCLQTWVNWTRDQERNLVAKEERHGNDTN